MKYNNQIIILRELSNPYQVGKFGLRSNDKIIPVAQTLVLKPADKSALYIRNFYFAHTKLNTLGYLCLKSSSRFKPFLKFLSQRFLK